MFNRLKGRAIHSPDYFLLAAFLLLTVFGLVMLSSASSDLGKIKFGDTYYYLRHQITFGLALGLLGFYLGNVISYRRYETISFFLLLASIGRPFGPGLHADRVFRGRRSPLDQGGAAHRPAG